MEVYPGTVIIILFCLVFFVGTISIVVSMIFDDDNKIEHIVIEKPKPKTQSYEPPDFIFGEEYSGIILEDEDSLI